MEILVSNIVGRTTRRNVNGREVIIAPLSLIVPGVLAGSQGPIFYPPEETARNVAAWNGMPLVVYHPTDNNGDPISAWDDSVVSIGVVKNAQMRAGRLVAEGWFDVATTKATDSRTYAAIENGKPMELSTGLFLDQEPAPRGATDGKGRPYRFIARNYRPDHVAILPDQIGACSQRDGCGLNINRVREADYGTLFHKVTVNGSPEWVEAETENCGCPDKEACNCEDHTVPTENKELEEKVSIWSKIGAMLGLNAGATQYKCPESGKWLPYGAGTGKGEPHAAAKEGHAGLTEGAASPEAAAKEGASTDKDEEEEPITSNTEGESTMDRKATIAYLTTNCGVWKGEEATLEKFSDEQLKKLKINAERAKANEAVANAVREASGDDSLALNAMPAFIKEKIAGKGKPGEKEEEEEEEEVENGKPPFPPKKPAANAELAALRAQVATLTANEEKRNRKEKVELVRRLTANLEAQPEARKARGLKLMKESIESLQDRLLDMPVAPTRNREDDQDNSDLDFTGAGVGIAANSEEDGEPLVPPTINWSELSEEHNKRRA